MRFSDSAGRLITVTDPLDRLTRYDRDSLDRVTDVTDPRSNVRRRQFNGNGECPRTFAQTMAYL